MDFRRTWQENEQIIHKMNFGGKMFHGVFPVRKQLPILPETLVKQLIVNHLAILGGDNGVLVVSPPKAKHCKTLPA
jgi:hypothetical protein